MENFSRTIIFCCLLLLSTIICSSLHFAADDSNKNKKDDDRVWKSFSDDGLHDPETPNLEQLQQPGEALIHLPPDYKGIGNQVDWVRALNEGYINPRSRIDENAPMPVWDVDIIMADTADQAMVRFPHKAHTDWLDCSNCHPIPFKDEYNANPIDMFQILAGNFCGQCHGAVAFPLTECRRCHSVSRKDFTGKPGPQPAPAKVYPPVKEQKAVK